MAANLTGQVRAIAEVTTAVARGDLSKKMTADAKGMFAVLLHHCGFVFSHYVKARFWS